MKNLDYIIQKALKTIVSEQAPPPVSKETNNAPGDAVDSPFTPAEEKFLGKFDAYGTTHIGIIYSTSDIGIREFITRSGIDLNITAGILASLLKQKVIKIVPYTGFGRNTDYTIELQLSLDDVKGLGAEDKEKAETGPTASGAATDTGSTTPEPAATEPAPEVAWVIPYGTLIKEATNIAKNIIKQPLTESAKQVDAKVKGKVWVKPSRMLKDMPPQFIKHLDQLITYLSKRSYSKSQHERIIADILDNLAINLKLNSKQIRKSYDFYKTQNKLQAVLDLSEGVEFINEFVLLAEDKTQIEYLTKLGLAPYITNAFEFWNEIPRVVEEGIMFDSYNEKAFYTLMREKIWGAKLSDKRKGALVIDAIGLILKEVIGIRGANPNKLKFCSDWYRAWANLKVPIPGIPGDPSLYAIINSPNIMSYVLDDDEWTKNFATLAQKFNSLHIGYIEKMSRRPFTPSYSDQEVESMVGTLIAPYQTKVATDAAGHDKIKPTFADTLTKEQKVSRGKFAVSEIVKKINSTNKTTFDASTLKGWVDSKGVGIGIMNINDDKYILYPSGKGIHYKNNKLVLQGSWKVTSDSKSWNISIV
jgi:hypothetical protein